MQNETNMYGTETIEEEERLNDEIAIKIIAWHILSCAEELRKAGFDYGDFEY